jgi:hypothetical protein
MLSLLAVMMLTMCIKPYEPDIKSSDVSKYVLSGQVSDEEGEQTVTISMTSPVGNPEFLPVSRCRVVIEDDKGRKFPMSDNGGGIYKTVIEQDYLVSGAMFRVSVHTPEGTEIISDYDRINSCPGVDSVYYELQDQPTSDPEVFIKGIRFFVDLEGKETDGRFYRWEAWETWEYHAVYPMEWWYDGTVHHVVPPDYSRMVCWNTAYVKNIYTVSTQNLDENRYLHVPLHYVDNKTDKLIYGYSLLIRQISLSEAAYNYWDQLRINSGGQEGLYQKQPLAIRGNLHNVTNPDQDVLGFFGAASVRSKRIFIRQVEGLEIEYSVPCNPNSLRKGLAEISPLEYPAYLMGDAEHFYMVQLNAECVNCLILGGTNVKPDFWPE